LQDLLRKQICATKPFTTVMNKLECWTQSDTQTLYPSLILAGKARAY